MDGQLSEIGIISVTTSIIEMLYPELKSFGKKVSLKYRFNIVYQFYRD